MATTGGGKKNKKKKGNKGTTLSLTSFLGDTPTVSKPATNSSNWADDDDLEPADLAEEYGGPPKQRIDLSKLPSAPRSSRGVEIDLSQLPSRPPYTAFLGNLPFETSEEDIEHLFRGLRVDNIRFPQGHGKNKGFGYAEFNDLDQLKAALALSGENLGGRQIRIDIAGKDQGGREGGGFSRGGFGGMEDDRTDGDWRRGGDGPPPPQRDDRRGGGGGGFDRRGPRDDVDGGRPMGAADMDDCWRRDPEPASQQPSNAWGSRGGRRDDGPRGGGFRDGPRDGGFRDGPRDGGFRDGPRDGGFRDGPRDGGFRDGPRDGGFRDGPRGGGFRDGPRDGGFRDGPRDGGFRDGPRDGGFRDGPRGGGFRDGPRDGPRDGGYRDGPRDGGHRDDRGPPDDNTSDDWRSECAPAAKEERKAPEPPQGSRPRLNLKPRTVDTNQEKTPTSSIFGGARPVDTASKERQIDEKLSKSPNREQNEDKPRDRPPPSRDNQSRDRPRERQPDQSRGRGRSAEKKKNRDKEVVPPKYEEPAKVVFGQTSKFSMLMADDEENEEAVNEEISSQ